MLRNEAIDFILFCHHKNLSVAIKGYQVLPTKDLTQFLTINLNGISEVFLLLAHRTVQLCLAVLRLF